jgi:transcriptional regulator with XRE-family HTH domain
MELYILVADALKSRNMTRAKLAELTGIRPAAISEICGNQRTTINRDHLTKIADALGITDIRELIELR